MPASSPQNDDELQQILNGVLQGIEARQRYFSRRIWIYSGLVRVSTGVIVLALTLLLNALLQLLTLGTDWHPIFWTAGWYLTGALIVLELVTAGLWLAARFTRRSEYEPTRHDEPDLSPPRP